MLKLQCCQSRNVREKHHLWVGQHTIPIGPGGESDAFSVLGKQLSAQSSRNASKVKLRVCGLSLVSVVPNPKLRTMILIYLAQALGLVWILEQPKSSAAEYHPRFRELVRRLPVPASKP